LLRLDWPSLDVIVIHRGAGLYYGMADTPWGLAVAARGRMVSSDIPIEEELGRILLFDESLHLFGERIAPFPLRDLHGIAWADEALWLTCAYDNQVIRYDGIHWSVWAPLRRPETPPYDINHFNTLWLEGNDLWLLAHNKGPSQAFRYHLPDLNLIESISIGNIAHNLWRNPNGALATCSSSEGALVASDGWKLNTGGFPRGIVFIEEKLVVGISELSERPNRDLGSGRLLVISRSEITLSSKILSNKGLVLDLLEWPCV